VDAEVFVAGTRPLRTNEEKALALAKQVVYELMSTSSVAKEAIQGGAARC